jgi:predicted RNase H-like HicB family nuclease
MAGPIGKVAQKYMGATINLTPVLRTDGKWTAFVHIDFPDRSTHDFGDFQLGKTKMEALQNAITAAEKYVATRKKK